MSLKTIFLLSILAVSGLVKAQDIVDAKIIIDTQKGHSLQQGSSGFNVRIADKVWSYSHPDFVKAVHGLKPGWLRYFSGTMGDAFSSATGLYDKDYAMLMDHPQEYEKGYIFTDVKGPHRITDLYNLLGEVGGKLVVTINGFTETPEIAGELARFCKNNNIKVEVWQFCNEPYFYVPSRQRYWWNNGYDYAQKMKPYADAILKVFPDAKLAPNYTWDGIWGFAKEINQYQQKNGAYWNVFSKHSYAPHVGGKESFEDAYRRANTKLIEVTDDKAMSDIEKYAKKDIPLLITEFGVWNSVLNGIYSAIYNAEYTLRQLTHPNALYIGSHEISNKYKPAKNLNSKITEAYAKGEKINTDSLLTGIDKDDEGKAMEIIHQATNNTTFNWGTQIEGGAKVAGMKNTLVDGIYASAFKGNNGFNYLAITNRSQAEHHFEVKFGGETLKTMFHRTYMWAKTAEKVKDVAILEDSVFSDKLMVPPFCVMMVKWKSKNHEVPTKSRIYKAEVTAKGASLTWWKREDITKYVVKYGTDSTNLNQEKIVNSSSNSLAINSLKLGNNYFFTVLAVNKVGASLPSDTVKLGFVKPNKPEIFKTALRDTTITVFWKSVTNASGYYVNVKAKDGTFSKTFDAKNVFGYRISGLSYNKPYQINITAYNGLGDGKPSALVNATCKINIPYSPRNISARETANGIQLKWINQDSVHQNVKYRLFRTEKLYDFKVLAENITTDNYLDKTALPDKEYFYTVKSYTAEGECNFYPNTATIIRASKSATLTVKSVEKLDDHYIVKVAFTNISTDGDIVYGIALSDVSYLNVEETKLNTSKAGKNSYQIKIPVNILNKGRTYAIKAYIQTNGGEPVFSLPPFTEFAVK